MGVERLRRTCNRFSARRRGRLPVVLPPRLESVHASYRAELARASLSAETRRTYASKVRQYLAWLDAVDGDGALLTDPGPRDRAVREWRTHLLTVVGQAPTTINNALAAVDDFYRHRGMGRAVAERIDVPTAEPRALDEHARLQWLRAVEAHPSPRDRALASIPFYAGARIAETVRLDTRDVRISARKSVLSIHGKGDRNREVPIHPKLRGHLRLWLEERPDWAGADTNPALSHHRGGACPCAAPATSSPASPTPPASATKPPPASCGIPSPPSCAAHRPGDCRRPRLRPPGTTRGYTKPDPRTASPSTWPPPTADHAAGGAASEAPTTAHAPDPGLRPRSRSAHGRAGWVCAGLGTDQEGGRRPGMPRVPA